MTTAKTNGLNEKTLTFREAEDYPRFTPKMVNTLVVIHAEKEERKHD